MLPNLSQLALTESIDAKRGLLETLQDTRDTLGLYAFSKSEKQTIEKFVRLMERYNVLARRAKYTTWSNDEFKDKIADLKNPLNYMCTRNVPTSLKSVSTGEIATSIVLAATEVLQLATEVSFVRDTEARRMSNAKLDSPREVSGWCARVILSALRHGASANPSSPPDDVRSDYAQELPKYVPFTVDLLGRDYGLESVYIKLVERARSTNEDPFAASPRVFDVHDGKAPPKRYTNMRGDRGLIYHVEHVYFDVNMFKVYSRDSTTQLLQTNRPRMSEQALEMASSECARRFDFCTGFEWQELLVNHFLTSQWGIDDRADPEPLANPFVSSRSIVYKRRTPQSGVAYAMRAVFAYRVGATNTPEDVAANVRVQYVPAVSNFVPKDKLGSSKEAIASIYTSLKEHTESNTKKWLYWLANDNIKNADMRSFVSPDASDPNSYPSVLVAATDKTNKLHTFAIEIKETEWAQSELSITSKAGKDCVNVTVNESGLELSSLFYRVDDTSACSIYSNDTKGIGDAVLRALFYITVKLGKNYIELQDAAYFRDNAPRVTVWGSLTYTMSLMRGVGYYQQRGFVDTQLALYAQSNNPELASTKFAAELMLTVELEYIHMISTTPIAGLYDALASWLAGSQALSDAKQHNLYPNVNYEMVFDTMEKLRTYKDWYQMNIFGEDGPEIFAAKHMFDHSFRELAELATLHFSDDGALKMSKFIASEWCPMFLQRTYKMFKDDEDELEVVRGTYGKKFYVEDGAAVHMTVAPSKDGKPATVHFEPLPSEVSVLSPKLLT